MAVRAVILNIVIILKPCYGTRMKTNLLESLLPPLF